MNVGKVGDMHEVIFTKNHVRMLSDEYRSRINDSRNCVIRHHVCPDGINSHGAGVGGERIFEKCVDSILRRHTVGDILEFMDQFSAVIPYTWAAQRRRLLLYIRERDVEDA